MNTAFAIMRFVRTIRSDPYSNHSHYHLLPILCFYLKTKGSLFLGALILNPIYNSFHQSMISPQQQFLGPGT